MDTIFQCAGCGQWNQTVIDVSAGQNQSYTEDCRVCCKPNVLHIDYDFDTQQCTVSSELE